MLVPGEICSSVPDSACECLVISDSGLYSVRYTPWRSDYFVCACVCVRAAGSRVLTVTLLQQTLLSPSLMAVYGQAAKGWRRPAKSGERWRCSSRRHVTRFYGWSNAIVILLICFNYICFMLIFLAANRITQTWDVWRSIMCLSFHLKCIRSSL